MKKILSGIVVAAGLLILSGMVWPGGKSSTQVSKPFADFALESPSKDSPLRPDRRFVLDGDGFYDGYVYLLSHFIELQGREVEYTGFVADKNPITPGSVFLGRTLFYCCAYDAYTIGFDCQIPGAGKPPVGHWFHLQGTLGSRMNPESGRPFPLLKVTSFHEVPAPAVREVYPVPLGS